jgi:hypothetical protein
MRRRQARLAEIAMAEAVCEGDYGGSHGTVFVSSARPGRALLGVNPYSEAHSF